MQTIQKKDTTAMKFRKATTDDLEQAWLIIKEAKALMASEGRQQWTEEYPAKDTIKADIDSGEAYVLSDDDSKAIAYAVITAKGEAAYNHIEGQWITAGPYLTIHRLAVAEAWRRHGLAREMMLQAEAIATNSTISSIRVDTNNDNTAMLNLLKSLNYTYCGIVSYGERGTREAFEKELRIYTHTK